MVATLLNLFKDYHFSVEEFNVIVTKAKQLKVGKNVKLLQAGHVCDKIWIMGEGVVRAYSINELGNDQHIWVRTNGAVFNNTESFLKQSPSRNIIETMTDCSMIYFTYEDVQYLYKTIPEFNKVGRVIIEQAFLGLIDEIGIVLQKDPLVRYHQWLEKHPDVATITPQHMIADMINVTAVHLSRLRSGSAKGKKGPAKE